jgi:hypothetical protein
MKLNLFIRRCARKSGHVGLGLRYLIPTPTIIGVDAVALESELQADLLLWQVRLRYTSAPRKNYQVW